MPYVFRFKSHSCFFYCKSNFVYCNQKQKALTNEYKCLIFKCASPDPNQALLKDESGDL